MARENGGLIPSLARVTVIIETADQITTVIVPKAEAQVSVEYNDSVLPVSGDGRLMPCQIKEVNLHVVPRQRKGYDWGRTTVVHTPNYRGDE